MIIYLPSSSLVVHREAPFVHCSIDPVTILMTTYTFSLFTCFVLLSPLDALATGDGSAQTVLRFDIKSESASASASALGD